MTKNPPPFDATVLAAHAGRLRGLARGLLNDAADGEDIVQETFRVALARAPRGLRNPGAWLTRVSRNIALRARRDANLRREHERSSARSAAVEDDFEQTEQLVRLQKRISEAVLELEEPYRTAIRLHYFDGLSQREVATRMGTSYEAARQRLSRAVAILRAKLDHDYGRRDAWSLACLAMARPPVTLGAALAAGTTMGIKAKLAGALTLLAAALTAVWWSGLVSPDESPPPELARSAARIESPASVADEGESAPARARIQAETPGQPAAPVSIDEEALLRGRVLDPLGVPAPGVEVSAQASFESGLAIAGGASQSASLSMNSDEQGRFALVVPRDRPLTVTARRAGFGMAMATERYAGETVELTLQPFARIHGRATRAEDGAPVSSASVDLTVSRRSEPPRTILHRVVSTDALGGFEFAELVQGDVMIRVTPAQGSAEDWKHVELGAGQDLTVDFALGAGVTIRGQVLDARTRHGIAGALVKEWGDTSAGVATDEQGRFELLHYSPIMGRDLTARAPSYGEREIAVQETLGGPVATEVIFELEHARSARGRVLDDDGKPLAGVAVTAGASDYTASTQQLELQRATSRADGTFDFPELRGDMRHTLCLMTPGEGSSIFEFPADELERSAIDFGDVVLHRAATLRGRVQDVRGAPIADSPISLDGANSDRGRWNPQPLPELDFYLTRRAARTDERGRFAFADLPPGRFDLAVRPDGKHALASKPVELSAGELREDFVVVVDANLAIGGRVLNENGEPLEVYVSIDPEDPTIPTAADVPTEKDGSFRAEGLARGSYTLSVWPVNVRHGKEAEIQYMPRRVPGVAAGESTLTIRLALAGKVWGRVLDAQGKLLERAQVSVHGADGAILTWVETDAAGEFELLVPARDSVEIDARPQIPSTRYGSGFEVHPTIVTRLPGVTAGSRGLELRVAWPP